MSKIKLKASAQNVRREHGVVCSFSDDFFGYFGWPTVAQTDGGVLLVAASGLRNDHVCPFGRTVLCRSEDQGMSWTSPQVVHDSPLDDRDAGLVCIGGDKLVLTWFTTDNRKGASERVAAMEDGDRARRWQAGLTPVTDAAVKRWAGAWMRYSGDAGQTWDMPQKVMLTTPHGPIRLRTGPLLFVGKYFVNMESFSGGEGLVTAMTSIDGGREWTLVGTLPLCPKTVENQYHEAHVCELLDGRLLALVRVEDADGHPIGEAGIEDFSMVQTFSEDRGRTWSRPVPLGFHGSPPHLLQHSSGVVICTYGYRKGHYGQRAMISCDGGQSWEYDLILRDDGPGRDLGYPSSVELADGSVFTVYYQQERVGGQCALLWTRWFLPD